MTLRGLRLSIPMFDEKMCFDIYRAQAAVGSPSLSLYFETTKSNAQRFSGHFVDPNTAPSSAK